MAGYSQVLTDNGYPVIGYVYLCHGDGKATGAFENTLFVPYGDKLRNAILKSNRSGKILSVEMELARQKWKNSPWVWQAVISNQIIIAKLVVDVLGDHFAEETRCEVVEEKMKRVENKEFLELISDSRPAQQEAIMADEDLVVVSAGAGTGKTETLARRYAWLVTTGRAKFNQILTLTFTEKPPLK